MKKEFLDYVEDIIGAMEDAMSFVKEMEYDDFVKDRKTVYAVVRALEIIGEAVKKVPLGVRNHYPKIPWKETAGMRNKLIHEYFGVDLKRVWKTVKEDIPNLKPLFEEILRDFKTGQA
jgi:uncharacterized protein with HEPN domain